MLIHQLLPRAFDVNQHVWGGLDFVALSIGINLAVFEIEKLALYGRVVRQYALKASFSAKLDLMDQDSKDAGKKFIYNMLLFLARCHRYVWSAAKVAAYLCVSYGAILIYEDASRSSYYIFLLIGPVFYITAVAIAVLALWLYCLAVRGILGVRGPDSPDDDIQRQLGAA